MSTEKENPEEVSNIKKKKTKTSSDFQRKFVAMCVGNKKRSKEFQAELLRLNKFRTCKKELSFDDVALIGLKRVTEKDIKEISDSNLSFKEKEHIAVSNFKVKAGSFDPNTITAELLNFVSKNENTLKLFMESRKEDISKHIQAPI
ncbi:MAG: hypothetical protein JKY09_01920 [Crocinitomicaceae bacterium]|nr:hypothetical protein [Crocinitomicaceae bacterium]